MTKKKKKKRVTRIDRIANKIKREWDSLVLSIWLVSVPST